MNKSLLVMICDFLLLSILALVKFDVPDAKTPPPPEEAAAPAVDSAEAQRNDMVQLMRQSLEEEAAQREALAKDLAEREKRLQNTAEELEQAQAERERLAAERAKLEQERTQLSSTVSKTQEELAREAQARAEREKELQKQLEQARQLQAELQARQNELAKTQKEAEALAQARAEAERRAVTLETNLQVAQTESKILRENLASTKAEVDIAREQAEQAARRAEQLSSNVATLAQTQAQSSAEIQRRIEEAQPITSNEIYLRYTANRVRLTFSFQRPQILGGWSNETSSAPAVLVRMPGGETYALVEASLTPFDPASLSNLRGASTRLQVGDRSLKVTDIGFLREDPRVLAIALPDQYVKAANLTPFNPATSPFRFPEAVLIGQQQDRYGEVGFRVSAGTQNYINLDSQVLSRLFGSFAPNRGDFVFAKTGNLVGVMVSNGRGVIVDDLAIQAYLPLEERFSLETARQLQNELTPRIPAE